jgi:hypothetical protein
MDTSVRLRLDASGRILNFLEAHPFGNPEADAMAAKFGERVKYARTLLAQEETGHKVSSASRTKRRELMREFRRVPYRYLRGVVGLATKEDARLAVLFRPLVRPPSVTGFQAWLESVLDLVTQHHEILERNGLTTGFADEVRAAIAEYSAAVGEADGGRRQHTGARVELHNLVSELRRMAAQLHGLMLYRLKTNPELTGAWDSARNVAWPRQTATEAGSAPAGEPTAGPDKAAA